MAELSGLQIFKYLPAAKKSEVSNCKKCGCPTCMAYALKLAKKQADVDVCPYIPDTLRSLLEYSNKEPQKTVKINDLVIGGENVLFRHEKTFINKTAIAVVIDTLQPNWREILKQVEDFEIVRVNETMKVDLVIFSGPDMKNCCSTLNYMSFDDFCNLPIEIILDEGFEKTAEYLIESRQKAVLDRDENYSKPVCVMMNGRDNLQEVCAKVSYYICKYANMVVLRDFDEALVSTLMTLRQNIFTDPQKPLQVESKIYEFNNPDENSLVFLTTNFALTFFAVTNELESLKQSSYLIVTPADGMSVLTAWSAEKFTANMVVNTLKKYEFSSKMKNRDIIIPGLLEHMKDELQAEINNAGLNFNIVIGTIEAFEIQDFVKRYIASKN